MVEEVPADRQVALDRDPHRLQLVSGADARTQQYRRTVDGAGAQHDLARADFRTALPFDANQHAGGPAVLYHDAIDQRVTPDFQVGAAACRLQIGFVGRDTAAVAAVDRVAGDALAIRSVEVSPPRIPVCPCSGAEPTVDRAPFLRRRAI